MEQYYESERDRLLVAHWRSVWQAQHDTFVVDTRHQCMLQQPSQIVRPFVCAPHFYGCLTCGQEHLCYRDARRCLAFVCERDGATLTCQYSGQVLSARAPPTFVGTHSEKTIADDNARHPLERYLVDERDDHHQTYGRFRPRRPMLYSNSRVRVTPKSESLPASVPASCSPAKNHREKPHPMLTTPRPTTVKRKRARKTAVEEEKEESTTTSVEEVDETDEQVREEDMLAEVAEECAAADYEEWDSVGAHCYVTRDTPCPDAVYWDEYYHFLDEAVPPTTVEVLADREEMEIVSPSLSAELLTASVAEPDWWYTPVPASLVHHTEKLVHRLLSLQTRTDVEHAVVTRVSSYFVARIQAISTVLTAVNAGVTLTEEQLCAALVLRLFGETYWDEDCHGHRIAIWHACAWHTQLEQCGAMSFLYGERVADTIDEDAARPRKRAKTTGLTRKRVEQWATHVRRALSQHCKGQPQWLRQFILESRGKLNVTRPTTEESVDDDDVDGEWLCET
jgi:hypothetical protein